MARLLETCFQFPCCSKFLADRLSISYYVLNSKANLRGQVRFFKCNRWMCSLLHEGSAEGYDHRDGFCWRKKRSGRGGKGTHRIFHINDSDYFTNHQKHELVSIFAKLAKNLHWGWQYPQEKKSEASLSWFAFSVDTQRWNWRLQLAFQAFLCLCNFWLSPCSVWSLNVAQTMERKN